MVINLKNNQKSEETNDKNTISWLVYIVLIAIIVVQSYPATHSKASSQNSISKTSSADWNKGTNSGITTTSDEAKISSAAGWADDNYGFRKNITVTAQTSNTVTKGHTLNLANVGSASFDSAGTGSYFNLGNSFNNIALPISVEAWINPKATETAIFMTDSLNGGSYYGVWFFIDSNKKVTINYGDGGGATINDRRTKVSNTAIELNRWTHVSGVIRGATDMSLYIDGVDAGGTYSGAGSDIVYSSSSTYETRIGAWNVGSPHTKGNIDELRIWSKARTQAEIAADMNKEIAAQANLEGYYNFNQTTGNLIDNSGHNITGTLQGATAYSPYSNVWGGVNTKALIDAGKMQADGDDLRLFYGSTEIERELIPAAGKTLATSEATQVLFKAQAQVSGGANDNNYYIYYGDSDATDPVASVYDKKIRTKNAYITSFDGAGTNYLQYSGDNVSNSGDGTIEFWYKYSNAGARHADAGPMFAGDDSNSNWYVWNDRWGYRVAINVGGNILTPSDPGNINDGRGWNHMVITWHNTDTAAQVKVYENNVLTASNDAGNKITSFPSYLKFADNSSSYDGIELGLIAAFNSTKDNSWVSSEYTRSTMMPIADGQRDASATFIHNFDGSSLDATAANGGYASGTSSPTSLGAIMTGDYRQGDTNDERAGNGWVSGVYNWFDNFDTGNAKSPGINEFGNISNTANELVLKNNQQALVNNSSANMPVDYRMEVSAKGTQPEILFNHQDKNGWWGNGVCMTDGANNNLTDMFYPRDAPVNFLSSGTSKYYLSIYNGFAPKYVQFDLASGGTYTGVVWEYWNGTAWTGFTPASDSTANFTKPGLVDISNIAASYGANAPADGVCAFSGNFNVVRVSASAVTTPATINQVNRVIDFAKLAFSATANVISGDSHNASGNTTIARAADAYKQIGVTRVGTSFKSYLDSYQSISTTTNATFDTKLLGLSATTDATFNDLKVYKALANEPTAAQDSETAKYATGSSYSSPTSTAADSGIIDLGWIGGWGTPNGFSANVTIPTNTSIDFAVRSSAVGGSNEADWTDWAAIGSVTSTGEYSVASASMPNITLGTNKYLQIKATFNTTDGLSTPVLSDYTIYYVADNDAPSNPSVGTFTVNGSSVTSGAWINSTGAVLASFSGSTDPDNQSGVAGYYIYMGTLSSADPQIDGAYQAHVGAAGDSQSFVSTVSSSDDGKYYYLIIKTKDRAGNVSSSATQYQFGYDKTDPTKPSFISVSPAGYTTANSFDFTWPAGADPSGANGASGIKYYEYRLGDQGAWSHTLDQNQTSVLGLQAYREGANVFYVRTVDKANNFSANYSQVTYYWSGTAPSKPTDLSISPEVSDGNSFEVSWKKPTVEVGNPPVIGYRYSINNKPTIDNTTYYASSENNVTLPSSSYATKQGVNTIYVVAVNEVGNYSLEDEYIASATFTCQTVAPPIPTSVSISDTTNRAYSIYSLTTKWSGGQGQDPQSFDHYVIERSTDGSNFTQLATTTSTAYIDAASLNSSTTYYYRIKAVDNAGSTSAVSTMVSKVPTGKYQIPPSYLSNPSISQVKSSSARVSWTTDRASNSIVKYGKTQTNLNASSGQLDSVLNHVVDLLGLEPSTTYYLKSQSLDNERDYESSEAESELQSFTTLAAPAISNVNVSNITLSSADVTWETTTLAVSSLNYGNNSNLDKKLDDVSGSNTTKHSVKISDLSHSTRYSFRISGTDADKNELTSDLYYFETLPMPKVDNLKLDLIKDKARPSIKVTWNTNVATSSIVKYTTGDETPKEEVKAKLVNEHEVYIENLLDETNYKVSVSGMDSIGNLTQASSASILTPQDSRSPQISDIAIETSNVGLNRQDKAQVVISWKTDEPATSRIEYGVGLSGENYEKQTSEDSSLSTNHVVILSDLEPTSPYHLKVISKDKAGNLTKSDDQIVVSSEVPRSVLRVLLNALEGAFGWIRL